MSIPVLPFRTQVTEEVTSTVSPQWAEIKVARETLIQRWDRRHPPR